MKIFKKHVNLKNWLWTENLENIAQTETKEIK